jgi:hypothetical protein
MDDRRVFQRFDIEIAAEFRSLEGNIEDKGKIVNISASGGGMIITTKYLLPGTRLEVKLLIPDGKAPLVSEAKVIWLKAIEPTLFLAGLQFDKVDFMGVARALRLQEPHNGGK